MSRGQESGNQEAGKYGLTGREREILAHVAEGMLNKEIAAVLHISEQTVKNHLFTVFRKLGVSDRTQAAVFALRNHILEL